jgi:VWFA-related protein
MHPRRAVLCGLLALLVVTSSAQQDAPTFRAETTYIEVDAFVTGSRGALVHDMTKEDFELLEDGRPQVISDFRFVDIPVTPASPATASRVPADVVTNVGERRVYVLLIEPGEGVVLRTQNVARRLVDDLLGPNDMMAVIHPPGTMSHAQAFTSSKALLHASIDNLPLATVAPGNYVLTLEARAGRRTVERQVPLAVGDEP